jgi:hypothetical protein
VEDQLKSRKTRYNEYRMGFIGVQLSNCQVSSATDPLDGALAVCRHYGFQERQG